MRINAINSTQVYPITGQYSVRKGKSVQCANSMSASGKVKVINFKGGNKDQAIFFGVEVRPYFQKGGVSTVLNDMRSLSVDGKPTPKVGTKEYWNQTDKVFVSPVYNGKDTYNYDTGILSKTQIDKIPDNLPEDSPFAKFKGKYFMTNSENFKQYGNIEDFFANEKKLTLDKNVFILEDVTGGTRKIDFGSSDNTQIKLFRVLRKFNDSEDLQKTRDFLVFTDVQSTWKAPYEGGGYASGSGNVVQSWKGDGDARASKAFIELMERICQVVSEDGAKFDPATLVLNDSQAANAVEYMAEKASKGSEFWQGKKAHFITHNAGAGYIQKTTPLNMFMNIADKELLAAVDNDPEFYKALKAGNDAVNGYFASKLPKEMFDAQDALSPFRNALYYVEHGYGTASTVSPSYGAALATNSSLAPGAQESLNNLMTQGRFAGIMNAFQDPNMSPFSQAGVGGYFDSKNEVVYTFPKEAGETLDGKEIKRYAVMDPAKVNETSIDFAHVREIKRQNKANLLERFDADVLEALRNLKDVKGHESDFNKVIAGLGDKKVDVYGYIDKKYIEEAKKPESAIKVLTSWGRGDAQKGLDSVLGAFEKYIMKFGDKDPNAVLIMGGALDLDKGNTEGKKIKDVIDRLNANPKLKGRFVYLDGFAPNKPLAGAADFALFPSRFAPCELTDLESYKMLCSPIVTNCQGLADKNFDASFNGEAERVTGYKTIHAFDMTLEQLRESNVLDEKDKSNLEKDVKKFVDDISNEQRIKHNKELNNEKVFEIIFGNAELHNKYEYEILRPYRDKIIESELVDCLERALITDKGTPVQDKMITNLFKARTDWEGNAELNGGKSSGDTYREIFHRDAGTVKEEDTLLYKVKQKCKDIIEAAKEKTNKPEKTTVEANSRGNKWLTITAFAVGALGLLYGILAGTKNHKQEPAEAMLDDEYEPENVDGDVKEDDAA